MSTHPYIPLYVDDYDAHTAHLSAAEDGIYGRLLRLTWRTPGCSLPDDPSWIARKIRLSPEDYAAIAQPVIDEFFKLKRGRLVQGRLKDEYDDISRKKSARKLAGKKGGEAKALKQQEKSPSIATILPEHTRAFPEPNPDPEPKIEAEDKSSAPATRPTGKRLSPTWLPSPEDTVYASGHGLQPKEILDVAEDFRDYWIARAGQGGVKLDWPATWRKWVRTHVERRGGARVVAGPGHGRGGRQGPTDFAEILARRRSGATS